MSNNEIEEATAAELTNYLKNSTTTSNNTDGTKKQDDGNH
jgi:hypothetical protein